MSENSKLEIIRMPYRGSINKKGSCLNNDFVGNNSHDYLIAVINKFAFYIFVIFILLVNILCLVILPLIFRKPLLIDD